jgi:hypothetical protein
MTSMKPLDLIAHFELCDRARRWLADYDDVETAWRECDDGRWLQHLLTITLPHERCLDVALACARAVLPMVAPGEERPRIAIEMAERYARGEVAEEWLRAAVADALAAAAGGYAAYAAYAYAAAFTLHRVTHPCTVVAAACDAADGTGISIPDVIRSVVTLDEVVAALRNGREESTGAHYVFD